MTTRSVRYSLAALLLLGSAGSACADGTNWTGFYFGGFFGRAAAHADWTNTGCTGTGCPIVSGTFVDLSPGDVVAHRPDGNIGGGHVGYNYQMGRIVVGAELSRTVGSVSDRSRSNFPPPLSGQDDDYTSRLRNITVATARLGVAHDNWLFYGRVGYALADLKTEISDTTVPNTGYGAATVRHSGLALGLGLEYAMRPNVILGIEYDRLDFRNRDYTVPVVQNTGGPLGPGTVTNTVDLSANVFMARLSFKLGRDASPPSPLK